VAKVDRVHSSDTQVFVDNVRIPMVNSVSLSSSKNLVDLPTLGVSHIQERVLGKDQTSRLSLSVIVCTGASGIDPLYRPQQRNFGFLNTGKYQFKIKDLAGVTTISGASLTSYSVNGSVGSVVEGSTSYDGDGAIYTSVGALDITDQTSNSYETLDGVVFSPQDIEITTTTNGSEAINSNSMTIQDFTISVSLSREPVTRIGERTPRFRYPSLPAQGDLSFTAIKNQITGLDLSNIVCQSGVIKIDLKDNGGNSIMDFTTSGCCLESVDESTDLDDNNTVSFSYYFPIIL
jgi:hypothetical protein